MNDQNENTYLSLKKICEFIGENEGLRLKAYKCTAGKTTIGYGRNLEDKGISVQEADFLLYNDIMQVYNHLSETYSFFNRLDENRKIVLVDMCFNLGEKGFSNFKRMIACFEKDDFAGASFEIKDSKYYTDVKNRAEHNRQIIMTGDL